MKLVPCLHRDNVRRGAVIVCPGGGYGVLAPYEGEPIAKKLHDASFQAFTLYYSCAPARYPTARDELFEAIKYVRKNADALGVKPDKIAVLGFSAGGHLAAGAGVEFTCPEERPDALILAYAVLSAVNKTHLGSFNNLLGDNNSAEMRRKLSRELTVRSNTPMAWIFHTVADRTVPVENALNFALALQEKNIPYELHIYPRGPHGMAPGRTNEFPELANWWSSAIDWLKRNGW